ncbi:MAG: hypothetical protein C4331_06870 [Meiothermus sp.]
MTVYRKDTVAGHKLKRGFGPETNSEQSSLTNSEQSSLTNSEQSSLTCDPRLATVLAVNG